MGALVFSIETSLVCCRPSVLTLLFSCASRPPAAQPSAQRATPMVEGGEGPIWLGAVAFPYRHWLGRCWPRRVFTFSEQGQTGPPHEQQRRRSFVSNFSIANISGISSSPMSRGITPCPAARGLVGSPAYSLAHLSREKWLALLLHPRVPGRGRAHRARVAGRGGGVWGVGGGASGVGGWGGPEALWRWSTAGARGACCVAAARRRHHRPPGPSHTPRAPTAPSCGVLCRDQRRCRSASPPDGGRARVCT